MFSFYRQIGVQRYQERHGLDFEDFALGQRFRHRPGVTLSQQDNVDEALDTLNGAMLHFDAHYAAGTAWQKPLMVSTLTLQRVMGMASKTYARRTAILAFPEVVLNGPMFGGDTLYAASEVLECDAVSGAITVRLIGHKADRTEIARITCRMAIARREASAGTPVEEQRFAAYHIGDDGALVEQCGLFFEDCAAGESFVHTPRRRFFPEELVAHARRSLELGAIERDGRVAVPEPFLIGATTALTTRHFGRVSANLGWLDVELPTPVLAGDTIEAESEVLSMRESKSRPEEGIVTVATKARNQHGEVVLNFRRNLLVYRRRAEAFYLRVGY
jgi:itaconyl-CoA hydratase